MTSATLAVIGITEIFLIAVALLMIVGVPLGVIVGLWLWQRGQRVPPAIRQDQGSDPRQTTFVDL